MQFVLSIEQFLQYFVLHTEHIFNRKGKYFFQNKQILKILFLKNTTKKYYTSTKQQPRFFSLRKKSESLFLNPFLPLTTKKQPINLIKLANFCKISKF